MKSNSSEESNFSYTPEQIDKRNQDIPTFNTQIDKKEGFFDQDIVFKLAKQSRHLSSSNIEYLSSQKTKLLDLNKAKEKESQDVSKKPNRIVRKVTERLLGDFEEESASNIESNLIPKAQDTSSDSISQLAKEPEIGEDESLILDLASEELYKSLVERHFRFYSILSNISDAAIASDLRYAYDIQDKIAYVIDNRTLLSSTLAKDLISYLDNIATKLEQHVVNIKEARRKYYECNRIISRLKEYKYRTDGSFKLLKEHKDYAEKSIERNLENLERSE